MAGAIALVRYQMVAYWRRSFAIRGKYDRSSLFLVLLLLFLGFALVRLAGQTAKSLAGGETGNLKWLLGIVFFAWLLPAFESGRVSTKLEAFRHLPLHRVQLALVRLVNVFLVPTAAIALLVSLLAIYPFGVAGQLVLGLFAVLFYSLFAAFSLVLFARLLHSRPARIAMFLAAAVTAVVFVWSGAPLSIVTGWLPHNLITDVPMATDKVSPILFLGGLAAGAFALALLSLFVAVSDGEASGRPITPRWFTNVRLPLRHGELVKKDFFLSWKLLDPYLSLLVTLVYALILATADLTFLSFGPAMAFAVMMTGTLAFNSFGTETSSGFQRLTLAPIRSEDLLRAKNRAYGMLVLGLTFFLFPIILFKLGPVYALAAILKTAAVGLLYAAWGNHLSIKFPFRMNAYEISFGGSVPDMMAAVFLISLVAIVPDFLLSPGAIAILLGNAVLACVSYLAYRFSLVRVSGKLAAEWENIGLKLS